MFSYLNNQVLCACGLEGYLFLSARSFLLSFSFFLSFFLSGVSKHEKMEKMEKLKTCFFFEKKKKWKKKERKQKRKRETQRET